MGSPFSWNKKNERKESFLVPFVLLEQENEGEELLICEPYFRKINIGSKNVLKFLSKSL